MCNIITIVIKDTNGITAARNKLSATGNRNVFPAECFLGVTYIFKACIDISCLALAMFAALIYNTESYTLLLPAVNL